MKNINSDWQKSFKEDLKKNLRAISNNFEKQLYIKDIRQECLMYACDMCLHFYKTGPYKGFLPGIIEAITYNVCVAMHSLVKDFNESEWQNIIDGAQSLLSNKETFEELQNQIDAYYQSFREI